MADIIDTRRVCACGCGKRVPHSRQGRYLGGHAGGRSRSRRYEERDCGYRTKCWVWLLSKKAFGHGQMPDGGLAHKAIYEALVGPVPEGYELHHDCETAECVNPRHLRLLTRQTHTQRHSHLTPDDIREIRASDESYAVIAARFEISESYVANIRARRRWGNVL